MAASAVVDDLEVRGSPSAMVVAAVVDDLEAVESGMRPESPRPLPTLLGQHPPSPGSCRKEGDKVEGDLQHSSPDQLGLKMGKGKGKGKGKQGGCLRRAMRMDPMVLVASVALVLLVVCLLAGIVLQFGFDLNAGPRLPHPSACLLEQLSYNPAIAMSPWNLANPQWVFGVCLIAVFVLRMFVFTSAARLFYGHLAANKQVKVANYMLELVGTTLALALCLWAGFFDLLLHPHDLASGLPTPEQAYRYAVGAQQTCVLFLAVYTSELYTDPEMRLGLALHHWTAIVLALWGLAAIHILNGSLMMVRCFFVVSLYMSTEQNVFVEMLMYQRRVYWPKLFYASAGYYFMTRAAIMIISLRTWWETRSEVFEKNLADSWVVYSLWLFIPLANAVLNASQMTTVQSLLGIAASVWQRCAELALERSLNAEIESHAGLSSGHGGSEVGCAARRRHTRQPTERLLDLQIHVQLVDVVADIDFDQSGSISRAAWLNYAAELLRDEWLIPRSAFEDLYEEMQSVGRGGTVTPEAFTNFFKRYMLGRAEFKLVLLAVAVQRLHATPGLDLNLEALLERKHQALLEQMLQQHCRRSAAFGAGGSPRRGISMSTLGGGFASQSSAEQLSWASAGRSSAAACSLGGGGGSAEAPSTGAALCRAQDEEAMLRTVLENLALATKEDGRSSGVSRRHQTWTGPSVESAAAGGWLGSPTGMPTPLSRASC